MTEDFDSRKARAAAWFRDLRDQIVTAFEGLEDHFGTGMPGRFEVSETHRGDDGGGGLMSVMRGGRVFEKVGVNISTVHGVLGARAQKAMAARAAEASLSPAEKNRQALEKLEQRLEKSRARLAQSREAGDEEKIIIALESTVERLEQKVADARHQLTQTEEA